MNRKPNVLLLFSDEHNSSVCGYAGDPFVKTTALDKIASDGVWLKNTYCQSPVCTPSRMSVLTGKEIRGCSSWNNHWVLFPENRTVAQHFSDSGYATCLVGKMHFGGNDQFHGFQNRPYGDIHHGLGHQPDPIDMFPNFGGVLHAAPSQIPESMQQEPIVTRETASWILEHMSEKPDQPWFACASYCKPHAPLTPPGRYLRKYRGVIPTVNLESDDTAAQHPYPATQRDNYGLTDITTEETDEARAAYWGAVEYLDDCIDSLLQELDKNDALENTIVIYISDHGDLIGNHGLWWKAIYYEEAVRVPFLISGPGIKQGAVVDDLVALTDLYPTLCGLAGLPQPDDIDGIDISPLLRGEKDDTGRKNIVSEYYGVGLLTRPYNTGSTGNSMRLIIQDGLKYVNTFNQGELLFDLKKDPKEYTNRIDHPDYRQQREELSATLNHEFSWEDTIERINGDRERSARFRSGVKPSCPNQYILPDGRIFDAELSLYNTRWLATDLDGTSGIIPQMYH